jgi:adenosylcobinamide-GDP ribazoletransferase
MLLGLKWATLVAIPASAFPLLIVAAHMLSRWCSIGLIWRLNYVRSDGEAKSRLLADSLSGFGWSLSGMLGAVPLLPVALTTDRIPYSMTIRCLAAATFASLLTAVAAAVYFKKRIGGYTGDSLGAVQQLCELSFLLAAVAVLTPMRRF